MKNIPGNDWDNETPRDTPLGTARWLTNEEAARKFPFDDSHFKQTETGLWNGHSNGQVWIGEVDDAAGTPVGYGDDRHVLLVTGTRSGKGTGSIITNLSYWRGSCVCYCPKGENPIVTARRRGNGSDYCFGMGQKVFILDPFEEIESGGFPKAHYNAMNDIDPSSDHAPSAAERVSASIVVVEAKGAENMFYEESARSFIKTLILYVLTAPEFEGMRNLVTVWKLATQGHWLAYEYAQKEYRRRRAGFESGADKKKSEAPREPGPFDLLWQGLRRNRSFNGLISGDGTTLSSMDPRTRDNLLASVKRHVNFIGDPLIQRVIQDSDFRLEELKTNPDGITIYLTMPQRDAENQVRWYRMMTALAIGEMERVKTPPATGYPTLFVLDEFAGLERMKVIENAAAQAGGFGVKFMFIVQSLTQLKQVYGDAWEVFVSTSGLKLFASIEDDFTRQYLCRLLGEREVLRVTNSGSTAETHGDTKTQGTSSTDTVGTGTAKQSGQSDWVSKSRTDGGNKGWSKGKSTTVGGGGSSGSSISSGPQGLSTTYSSSTSWSGSSGTNESISGGSNWSDTTGTNSSYSQSLSLSDNESTAKGTNYSDARSYSTANTKGWSETVHKRNLLNPDEIGQVLGPVSDPRDPRYPGFMAALVIGERPMLVRRVNYFESARFAGLFDPHPAHVPPPTLKVLAARVKRYRELALKFIRGR